MVRSLAATAKCTYAGLALASALHAYRIVVKQDIGAEFKGARTDWTGRVTGVDVERVKQLEEHAADVDVVLLAFIALTATVFLTWLWRAKSNAATFTSAPQRCSPAMAVVVFFIPVINLFRPYQAVQELYDTTKAKLDRSEMSSNPVAAWWLCYMVGGLVGMCGGWQLQTARSADDLHGAMMLAIVSSVLAILSAALCALVVHSITAMHAEIDASMGERPVA